MARRLMTEQTISVDRLEQIINVFGSFDENMKIVEQSLKVDVINRGTELKVSGEDENVMKADKVLDGLNLTSLKGALMSRAMREIARLIKALGGNELSAYGLCHLGDYEATVFSEFSHNRKFGEAYVRGEEYTELAEGYYTVKALILMSEKYRVELPICKAVYQVLYEHTDFKETLNSLFLRSLKQEF
jgi:glycerol-3-phosphate dehydrogenase